MKRVIVLLLMVLIAACVPSLPSSESATRISKAPLALPEPSVTPPSLSEIQDRGFIRVGTAFTKPFEFLDPKSEELIGFDVDIMTEAAHRMGIKDVQWLELPFVLLLPALQDGRVDVVIAAMHVTPDRERLVDFSVPYAKSGLVIVTRADLADKIHAPEDLANKRVGVKIGATGENYIVDLKIMGVPITMKTYPSSIESLLDLEVGRLDAVLNDYLNTRQYFRDNDSNLVIAHDTAGKDLLLTEVGLGIAVAEGNVDLKNELDAALNEMHFDGTIERCTQQWLPVDTNH